MTVKAKWFDTLPVPAAPEDPFSQRVEDVGRPVRLDSTPELNTRLAELVNRESALYARGVTCSIKDHPDTCCNACPVRQTDGPLSLLCAVGTEQEHVLTRITANAHSPR